MMKFWFWFWLKKTNLLRLFAAAMLHISSNNPTSVTRVGCIVHNYKEKHLGEEEEENLQKKIAVKNDKKVIAFFVALLLGGCDETAMLIVNGAPV